MRKESIGRAKKVAAPEEGPPTPLAKRIRGLRLDLTPRVGYAVTPSELGRLVARVAGGKPRAPSTVQRWEEQGSQPALEDLRALAWLGGMAFHELVFGEPEPPRRELAELLQAPGRVPVVPRGMIQKVEDTRGRRR